MMQDQDTRKLRASVTDTEPLEARSRSKLRALRTDIDDFQAHDREVYWLCLKRQSESTFSNAVLEKTLGKPSTLRGMSTIQKLAAKYALTGS